MAQDGPGLLPVDESGSLLSTESLTSSILDYRKIHGRTYANAKTTDAIAPNDARQNELNDLIHNALVVFFDDQLVLAPIDRADPGRVLDVGTGTGSWAMDFADEFPAASVIGTDLSPVQPTWVPPNLVFEIDDCALDWTWPEDHFNLVHIRCLYGCVPDWPGLYARTLRHLAPGGWFQHLEVSGLGQSDVVTYPPDHVIPQWAKVFAVAGDKMGRPVMIADGHTMRDWMIGAGFADVVEKKFKLPVSGWPREPSLQMAGLLMQEARERDLEGSSEYMLTQVLLWAREEALVFVAKMKEALKKKENCPYITV